MLEPKTVPVGFSTKELSNRIGYFLREASGPESIRPSTEKFSLDAVGDGQSSQSDYLMAMLLQRYPQDAEFEGNYLLRFGVDVRRLLPELSPLYFGNAVRDALLRLPRHPKDYVLSELAALIGQAKASIDEKNVRDAMVCYCQFRAHQGIEAFERLQFPGLLVSNLTRLPMARLDFGMGSPAAVELGTGTPRLAVLQADGSGRVTVTHFSRA